MPVRFPTTAARTLAAAALTLALAPGLASCANDDTSQATPPAATTAAATTSDASTPAADETDGTGAGMEVLDSWTKAVPELSGMPMTGVFGIVRNTSDQDIVLVSGSTDASDRTELHTTVNENGKPVMKAVEKLTIPAGGSLVLQPGGDHIMVMNLAKPIAVGDTVTVTLTTQDGQNVQFKAVAKQFTGANEPYHTTGTGMTSMPTASPSS